VDVAQGAGGGQRIMGGSQEAGDLRSAQQLAAGLQRGPADISRQAAVIILADEGEPGEDEGGRQPLSMADAGSRVGGDATAQGVGQAEHVDHAHAGPGRDRAQTDGDGFQDDPGSGGQGMLLTIDAHQDIGALGGELPGTSAGADAGDAAVIIEGDRVAVARFALPPGALIDDAGPAGWGSAGEP